MRAARSVIGGLQRQIAHLSFPFALKTALHNQNEVGNRAGEAQAGRDLENSAHRLARRDTLVGVLAECRNVVRDQHATLASPLEGGSLQSFPRQTPDSVTDLNRFLEQAKRRVPQDKQIVLIMTAYDRNGRWINPATLAALQVPCTFKRRTTRVSPRF